MARSSGCSEARARRSASSNSPALRQNWQAWRRTGAKPSSESVSLGQRAQQLEHSRAALQPLGLVNNDGKEIGAGPALVNFDERLQRLVIHTGTAHHCQSKPGINPAKNAGMFSTPSVACRLTKARNTRQATALLGASESQYLPALVAAGQRLVNAWAQPWLPPGCIQRPGAIRSRLAPPPYTAASVHLLLTLPAGLWLALPACV